MNPRAFSYSRSPLSPADRALERTLEILPAVLSWGLLWGTFFFCLVRPVAGAVLIILFDLYWLFRLVYFMLFLLVSYLLLEVERSTHWRERLEDFTPLEESLERLRKDLPRLFGSGCFKRFFSEQRHLKRLTGLKRKSGSWPNPSELYHLVIIPFYREGITVLESTLQALTRVNYPLERLVVVLGVEERAGKEAEHLAKFLKAEQGDPFFHFETCLHPEGIPGERAVKGANATHAARWAKGFFETKGIPLDHVIVSCFDSDTVVSPEYFACLTYNYVSHPKRTRTSFQPIPVYHNNLWQAPAFGRVIETGSSFLQLVEVTHPEKLVTFSSHSMSFQALVEGGYWPVDLISDDSAIFWKSLLAFDGDYRVQPMYVTVSMDVALGENFWQTCVSIYQQKRRWAWGVENFPLVVRGLLANPRIPWHRKLSHASRLLETNISWATWTPMMVLLSWVPAFVVTGGFGTSVVHFNAPRIAGVISNLAMAALGISIVLSLFLLPKRREKVSWFKKLTFAFQWLFVPLTAMIFGAMPALDAQMRLALGRYLEFNVAPKGVPKGGQREGVTRRTAV